jgi:hypothetical protein
MITVFYGIIIALDNCDLTAVPAHLSGEISARHIILSGIGLLAADSESYIQ